MICTTAYFAVKTTDNKFACVSCAGTTGTPANNVATGYASCTPASTYANIAAFTSL